MRTNIVDEQPLFRQGIRSILNQMGGCRIVGEPTEADEVLDLVRTGSPDVALIADGLRPPDALDLVPQLRQLAPSLAMIILTPSEDEERLFQCLKVGAAAYLTRAITTEALQEAVRKVSKGEYVITADVLVKTQKAKSTFTSSREVVVREAHTTTEKVLPVPLTGRELEMLDYIAQGLRNKVIARALPISAQTAKNHITSILKTLAVQDRTAAVVYAMGRGWIKMHKA